MEGRGQTLERGKLCNIWSRRDRARSGGARRSVPGQEGKLLGRLLLVRGGVGSDLGGLGRSDLTAAGRVEEPEDELSSHGNLRASASGRYFHNTKFLYFGL